MLLFFFSTYSYLSTGLHYKDKQLGSLVWPQACVLPFSSNGVLSCRLNPSQSLMFWLEMKPQSYLNGPNSPWVSVVRTPRPSVQCSVLKCSYSWLFLSSVQDDPAQAQPFCSCIFFQHIFLEDAIVLGTFQTWRNRTAPGPTTLF